MIKNQENGKAGGRRLPELRRLLPLVLLLWCALPVLIAGVYYAARYTAQGEWLEEYRWIFLCFEFHTRAFYLLGGLLFAAAVLQLFLFYYPRRGLRAVFRAAPWHLPLLFLLCWAVVCTLRSDIPVTQTLGIHYLDEGLVSWVIYGAFYLAAVFCGRWERLDILRVFTGAADLMALIALGQAYGFPPVVAAFYPRPLAIFQNINYLGYYLCMSLCCLFGLWLQDRGKLRGGFYLLSFALQTCALLLNNTFGCYLAVLLAMPLVLVYMKKRGEPLGFRAFLPVLCFLLLSLLRYFNLLPSGTAGNWARNFSRLGEDVAAIATDAETAGMAGSGRFRIWRETLKLIAQRPIFGYGPEGLQIYTEVTHNGRPHLELMQYAAFFGIPGMLAYAAALVLLFVNRWKALPRLDSTTVIAAGGVTGYLISSMFGITLYATAPFFFLLLGFCAAEPEQDAAEPERDAAAEEGPALTEPEAPGGLAGFARRTPIWRVAAALLVLVLAGGSCAYALTLRNVEKTRENMDISAWNAAWATAMWSLRSEPDQHRVCWYDARRFALVPAEEDPPAPYGMGTRISGQTLLKNVTDYKTLADYTDKILRVEIDTDAPAEEVVTLEWVTPSEAAGKEEDDEVLP